MALNKSDIPRPALPKETVSVPELNGEVVVRALLLRERLELSALNGVAYGHIAETLARTVLDAAGVPIFSAEEWEIWGADRKQEEATYKLFAVAQRLSGMGGEKKEEAPS